MSVWGRAGSALSHMLKLWTVRSTMNEPSWVLVHFAGNSKVTVCSRQGPNDFDSQASPFTLSSIHVPRLTFSNISALNSDRSCEAAQTQTRLHAQMLLINSCRRTTWTNENGRERESKVEWNVLFVIENCSVLLSICWFPFPLLQWYDEVVNYRDRSMVRSREESKAERKSDDRYGEICAGWSIGPTYDTHIVALILNLLTTNIDYQCKGFPFFRQRWPPISETLAWWSLSRLRNFQVSKLGWQPSTSVSFQILMSLMC